MKANNIAIFAALAVTTFSSLGATITILPVTPYRSLNDSPWRVAVLAGDALKFGDQFCNFPATTLSDGLGVHDDFEDEDCLSPWLRIVRGRTGNGASVDADDGFFGETPGGTSFTLEADQPAQYSALLEFLATTDARYPNWFGFAVTGTNGDPVPAMADLLGTQGGLLMSINLTNILGTYLDAGLVRDDVFLGFVSDQPIGAVVFRGGGLILDHFQYGYGTSPIPEPACATLVLAALFFGARRRGQKHQVITSGSEPFTT